MIEKVVVRVHLSSGVTVSAIWTPEPDQELDEVEQDILALLEAHPREFIQLGDLIVHTGAVSAVEVVC